MTRMTPIYVWLGLLTGAWAVTLYLQRRLLSEVRVVSALRSITDNMIMLPSVTDPRERQVVIDRMRGLVTVIARYDPASSYKATEQINRAAELTGSR
jgi:hypothetical protein